MNIKSQTRNLKTRGGNNAETQYVTRLTGDVNQTIFQSYNSVILTIDFQMDTLTFGNDWDYSRTTMKYLHQFIVEELRENLNSADIRKALKNGELKTAYKTWIVKEG